MTTSQLSTQLSADGSQLTIKPRGHFGFAVYEKFRAAYERRSRDMHYVVDLGDVATMDSSALGMLLVLREHQGGDQARIEITHCSTEVRKILQIANFERLFRIS
jgi:anti-anti-sigma factor